LRGTLGGRDSADLRCLAFSPDGRTSASSSGGKVKLWDVGTGQNTATLTVQEGRVYWGISLAFSPDGKVLAVGHASGQIKLWNMPDAR
jgi:WD40 repeat protein